MISEGNCLLERREKRFDTSAKNLSKVMDYLLSTKLFTKERFFGKYFSTFVSNRIFDTPESVDMKIFGRKNYEASRLRTYFSPDLKITSFTWGEWKTKFNKNVVKTRKVLKSKSSSERFLKGIAKKGLVEVVCIVYKRSALNSIDGKIRITFDLDTHYFNMAGEDITNQTNNRKGVVKIKLKYSGGFPRKIAIGLKRLTKNV